MLGQWQAWRAGMLSGSGGHRDQPPQISQEVTKTWSDVLALRPSVPSP
jgi:hypothetical protein